MMNDPLTQYQPYTRQEPAPPEPEANDDKWEVFARSLAEINPVSSYLLYGTDTYPSVKGYNPYSDPLDSKRIAKYDPELFQSSYSPEQTDHIMKATDERQISLEKMNRNPWTAALGIAGGVVSNPLMYAGGMATGIPKIVAAEMAVEAGNEALLHQTQPTRTIEESAVNVGITGAATGALGLMLHGANRLLNTPSGKVGTEEDAILRNQPEQPIQPERQPAPETNTSTGAMQADEVTMDDLAPTFGIANKFMHLSSTGNAYLKTKSVKMRQFLGDIVPLPFQTKQQAQGKANQTAWALSKKHDDDIVMIEQTFNKEFLSYRKDGGVMNEERFAEEVGTAMSNGDRSNYPQVEAVAKAYRVLDDELYDSAAKMGLYGEERQLSAMDGIKPVSEGAETHIQRIYKRDKLNDAATLTKLRTALKNKLSEQIPTGQQSLIKVNGKVHNVDSREVAQILSTEPDARLMEVSKMNPETLDKQIDEIASSIIRNLKGGNSVDEISDQFLAPKPGTLHERSLLLLDDNELEGIGILHKDAREILTVTSSQMRRELALQEIFGERDLKGVKESIHQDYDKLIRQAEADGNTKAIESLEKRRDEDVRYVDDLRNQFMSTYQTSPKGALTSVNNGVRMYNTVALLVAPMLTNLPDLVSPMLRNGLLPVAKVYGDMITGGWTKDKELVNALGMAVESLTGNRVGAIMEGGGQQSRWQKKGYQKWAKWGGMNLITDIAQAASTLLTVKKWNKQFKNYDSLPKREKSRLAESGIDKEGAELIAEQLDKYAKQDKSFINANIEAWDDEEAKTLFQAALRTEVYGRQVLEPMAGDMPKMFESGELGGIGKTMGQFMRYVYSGTQRWTVMGLQRADAEFLQGFLMMSAVGYAVNSIKSEVRGKQVDNTDPVNKLLASIDRGGSMGFVGTVPSALYSVSTGDYQGRMMARDPMQIFTGPAAEPIFRALNIMAEVRKGKEMTEKDWHQIVRATPVLNFWHLSDIAELLYRGRGYSQQKSYKE